jgi:putative heme-binding domain-containing protein
MFATTSRFAAAGLVLLAMTVGADEPKKSDAKTPPARVPWTTSKVVGSPDPPPPFKAVRVFPNVKINHPLLIARCPGSDRLFVGEQEGVLYSIANKPDAKAEVFFDLRKEIKTAAKTPGAGGIEAVYGLVFHPKFEQNRLCYVCYTLRAKDGKPNLADGTRVSRFKVTDADPPRIDPASEEVVITFLQGGHNGGDLHFGPKDGMLYISSGDAANPNPPDSFNTGQDCSDLLSSVLRIDVDRKDAGKNYAVPADNPFVGMKDVRPEIWAFGFRNPWRMSFDRQTGQLWLGDVGWELWEMVHRIEKGGNYGWSIMEARQPVKPSQKPGPTPIHPPMIELSHTIAASVTGGYVYRGKRFPELVGAYVFGDWETRRIWAARFDGDRVKEMPEVVKPSVRVVAFGEDNAGELYFFDYDTGFLYTLERNDAAGENTNFPKTLSATGLFKDVKTHQMAEGVIEFKPNVGQWQDGARAKHYLALPGTSSVTLFDKPRQLPGQVFWHNFRMQFPKDAVLVKTIHVKKPVDPQGPATPGVRSTPRRVETRVLHFDGEDWHGYSYAWRDDESEADLVPADGAERVFPVADDSAHWLDEKNPVVIREQVWTFHSRTQCMTCHNAWTEYTLAFNVGQLNGFIWREEQDGGRYNQLVRLSRDGVVRRVGEKDNPLPPFDEPTVAKEVSYPGIRFGSGRPGETGEHLARAYLHVNCAHCHRFGGGGGQVVLELDYSKSLKETGILGTKPRQGDFGIPDARLVAPGDAGRSVLLYRMAKFGRGRMPHLGSEWPDAIGVRLVEEWIGTLGKKEYKPIRADLTKLDRAFSSFDSALPFSRLMGNPAADRGDREKVTAAAAKLPPGPVRDLFEGYLPPDPKGRRLGSNPRPASILTLTGDAKKGEAIFFDKESKCANCHKTGDRGTAVGPELTAIGKTRTKVELLDSILQPSAKVDPQFAAYLVKTHDGRSFTGMLVKRDEKQVIVRDAENKETALDGANVEAVQPSRLSLMPDGLVSGLTPQEAADLLEFLASRK